MKITQTVSTIGALRLVAVSRWQALRPRERTLVTLAAAMLGCALVWLVLLRPALRTTARAPGEIADLRASLSRIQEQGRELAGLESAAAPHAPPADLGAAASAWLRSNDSAARVAATPLELGVRLKIEGMAPSALPRLAEAARRDWGAEVVATDLKTDAAGQFAGSVDIAPIQGPDQ